MSGVARRSRTSTGWSHPLGVMLVAAGLAVLTGRAAASGQSPPGEAAGAGPGETPSLILDYWQEADPTAAVDSPQGRLPRADEAGFDLSATAAPLDLRSRGHSPAGDPPQEAALTDPPRLEGGGPLTPLQELIQQQSETTDQLDRLQRRVQELLQRRLAEKLSSASGVEDAAAAEEAADEVAGESDEPTARPRVGRPAEHAPVNERLPRGGEGLPAIEESPVDSAPPPVRVLDQPVDRLSLADSLYRSGQLELAASLYGELHAATPADLDRLWVAFQLAHCHRRLGQWNDAQRLLREVANAGGEEFPIPQARWWLGAMDGRRALEQAAARLESLAAPQQARKDFDGLR